MSIKSLLTRTFSSRRFNKTGISSKGEPQGSYVTVLSNEPCTYETLNNPVFIENGKPVESGKQKFTVFTFYGIDVAQGDLLEINRYDQSIPESSTTAEDCSSSSSSSSFVDESSSSTDESSSSSESSSSHSSSSTEDSSSSSSSSSDPFATSEDDSENDAAINDNVWMKVLLVDDAAARRHHLELVVEIVEFSREFVNG